MNNKIKRLYRWDIMKQESTLQAEKLCNEIIDEMISLDIACICADDCIATLTQNTEYEFDIEAFRQAMPDIYASFVREITQYKLILE